MGNRELRVLLVLGATSVLRIARNNEKARPWLKALLARRPFKVAAVAPSSHQRRDLRFSRSNLECIAGLEGSSGPIELI